MSDFMESGIPNPRGELTTCVRCRKQATFTREAICLACRTAESREKPKKPKGGGDR